MSVTLVIASVAALAIAARLLGKVVGHVLRHAAVRPARERLAGLTEVVQAWQAVNRDEIAVFDQRMASMEASLITAERRARAYGPRMLRLEQAVRADPRWRPAPRLWVPPTFRR